jgi:hypothetical protein
MYAVTAMLHYQTFYVSLYCVGEYFFERVKHVCCYSNAVLSNFLCKSVL